MEVIKTRLTIREIISNMIDELDRAAEMLRDVRHGEHPSVDMIDELLDDIDSTRNDSGCLPECWNKLDALGKGELVDVIMKYDNYIYNDGEPWDEDRQPVCFDEFYNCEYMETEDYE